MFLYGHFMAPWNFWDLKLSYLKNRYDTLYVVHHCIIAHSHTMLSVTLKGQRSAFRHMAMLKIIFWPIFAVLEDILIGLMSIWRGSICPFNGLQPFWCYAKVNKFNLVSEFENRPIHHIGKCQDSRYLTHMVHIQFAKTILQVKGQSHRADILGFKSMTMCVCMCVDKCVCMCVDTTYQTKIINTWVKKEISQKIVNIWCLTLEHRSLLSNLKYANTIILLHYLRSKFMSILVRALPD